MKKIAIHKGYGGFKISQKAMQFFAHYSGFAYYEVYKNGTLIDWYLQNEDGDDVSEDSIPRDDPVLIEAFEAWPQDDIKIVEIPDDVNWKIMEYDGNEWVCETHRTWS